MIEMSDISITWTGVGEKKKENVVSRATRRLERHSAGERIPADFSQKTAAVY